MVEYDPFSYEIHEDPYPTYRQLRDQAPAYFSETHGFWALSRYEDVRNALRDHETFCSGQGFLLEDIGDFALPMIIGMDPPHHTRVRDTINRTMTHRRVEALEIPIRRLARRYLDRFAPNGRGDLIEDFAGRLPMHVISSMLGVPETDRETLRGWADEMLHREDRMLGVPETGKRAAARIYGYFEELLRRRSAESTDDILGLLTTAEAIGEISHEEILGFCFLLIIAGNETTTKLIGNIVVQLSRYPEQKRILIDDRRMIPDAVEEVLRFDPSTHMMARTLTRDVNLHGRTLEKGRKVALLLASANRDERRFPDPDTFDFRRDSSGHLGFGLGVHFCLGASLARLQGRICLEEILARIPDFRVDEDALERVHSGNVRGYSKVPLRFSPSPTGER